MRRKSAQLAPNPTGRLRKSHSLVHLTLQRSGNLIIAKPRLRATGQEDQTTSEHPQTSTALFCFPDAAAAECRRHLLLSRNGSTVMNIQYLPSTVRTPCANVPKK